MSEDKKFNFLNKEERKEVSQRIAEGFYDNPEEIKKWYHIKLGLEKFLKDKKDLEQTNILIYQECSDLLNKIQWFCVDYLSSNDFINLFKTNLKYVLSNETYPLERQLSIFLLNIPELSLRDEYKTRIREAVLANEEEITPDEIILGTEKKIPPTIANWLSFYDQTLGTGEIEKLRVAEILFKDRNIIHLSIKDNRKIKRLFVFYEELKISAMTVEGLEEEDCVVTEEGLEVYRRNRVESIAKLANVKTEIEEKIISEKIEQEIERNKIEKEMNEIPPQIDLETAINNVTNKTELNLSENEKKRFQNIISSFFRDIRTQIETKIVLKREQKIGGMEFNQEITDKIIEILIDEKSRIDKESIKELSLEELEQIKDLKFKSLKEKTDEIIKAETKIRPTVVMPPPPVPPPPPPPPPVPPPPSPPLKPQPKASLPLVKEEPKPVPPPPPLKPQPKASLPLVKEESKSVPVPPPPPLKPQPKASLPLVKEESKPVPVPPPPLPPPPSPPKLQPKVSQLLTEEQIFRPIIHPQPVQSTRPRVEEIKVKPRIYGPIEELKTLALVDWRRWGSSEEAVQKIEDKINLLAEESLVKKSEGIRAWKDSEINNLYLDIGAESIDQGKSVTEIILQRQQKGSPTLTEEEFNSVVELNQKLRF